ncbi:hypothetical protein MADA3029_270049 [Vibrio nigripulchritudo MADA3029]|nr:hypothetical protein VIBNIMADA3020_420049 [Vibrio nigripulchritudo MADA3020]CCN56565.1 hypothetical protein VIBNIMADA3021_970060 [Vibrio nigripulchritudo MADA3021]CCN58812.1 hypothetical protein MADA3029_270049 [Vibrio nigripulchritudo MADA3029]
MPLIANLLKGFFKLLRTSCDISSFKYIFPSHIPIIFKKFRNMLKKTE